MLTFTFPVGYHDLHKVKIIDFQLNRWYSLGYARLEDMSEAGSRIQSLDDWKPEMVRQAEKAMSEGRVLNGTFYYRAAEFFTHPKDPDKQSLYDRFIDLFYGQIVAGENITRHLVPYEGGFLPALVVTPRTLDEKGVIVVHGGFDSLIEEFYSMACYFAEAGYRVVMFEGPGQGGALRRYGLALTHEWEKVAKAVLDYFALDDVTWLGISMGGWMCFRAAAFEPRIKRVVASSIAYDYMQMLSRPLQFITRSLFRLPRLLNYLGKEKMKRMPQENWGGLNLMFITRIDDPVEASRVVLEFNERNLHSELVTQDVLILTGAEDHFIPLKMHKKQVAALTAARSITERIFTRAEQGQNHCQIGNFGLALRTVVEWLAHLQDV